ncbi:efflux RND transporter periplasmic adaptor subunit [Spirochaeta dissipatitropha]
MSSDLLKKSSKIKYIIIALILIAAVSVPVWLFLIQPRLRTDSLQNEQTSALDNTGAARTAARGSTAGFSQEMSVGDPVPVQGEIYTASLVPSRQGVEISGNLQPGNSSDAVFMTAGIITELRVSEGQAVRQGQVLARLDTTDVQYQLASREYDLEQERLSGSPRRLQLLEMQYEQLRRQLNDYVLTAAISGRVSAVHVEQGSSVTRGQTALRIIDTNSYKAQVQIDELDIIRVSPGQEVEVFLDALPDVNLYGSVESVGLEGTATGQGYAVVPVRISFPEADSRIIPGFSFSGSIYVAGEEEAVIVDRRAVQTIREPMGIVYLVDESGREAVPVTVQYEAFGQLNYRITAGIEAGSRLMGIPAAGTAGGSGLPTIRIPGVPNTGGLPGSGAQPAGNFRTGTGRF